MNYITEILIYQEQKEKFRHFCKIMNILNTEIIITFNCLTEYSVYYLLNDLRNSNYAFFIVEELDIRKIKNIDKNLIKTLIEEGNANLLSVTMKLQWYELSGK